VAEANVSCDPHAADTVFTAPWPVTIVGLDVTHEVLMDAAAFERLREHGGDEGAFLCEASRHYIDFHRHAVGVTGCFVHDASAAAWVVAPELFGTRNGSVRVACDGIAVGQTIQRVGGRCYSQAAAWDGLPEQRVCTAVQGDAVLDLLLRTLGRRTSLAR
jgi:inosine-uridine nucleoside N-ribohydrolase